MRNMFKQPHDIMLYKERTEFQEFGRAKPPFRQCAICGAIYYTKSWHHPRNQDIRQMKKDKMLLVTRCPACQMEEQHQYEGELDIENIPKQFQSELYHMIKAYVKRSYDHDCQHRLIELIRQDGKIWKVLLTENQLANKLAQKIREVFDQVDVKVLLPAAPHDVERVKINFQPVMV